MSGAIVAFTGKGGSGKTTLAAMTLRRLIRTGVKPILAVDADPNATLALTLGVEIPGTIADLRDNVREAAQKPSEISTQQLTDQYLAETISEQSGFDLLTMGRPEGPGCYCYVNALLRRYLSILKDNYAAVLVDCEAGMEYLSRLVVDDVDAMVLVAEATAVGLVTAGRIADLADSLPVRVRRRALAINKIGQYAESEPPPAANHVAKIDTVVHVPFDADLARRCALGEPVDDEAGPAAQTAIEELADWCMNLAPHARPATEEKEPKL